MTGQAPEVQRLLPAIPYVVLRDSVPARLVEKAFAYGWRDEQAEADLARGRQAVQGRRWRSTAALDADLIRHRRAAFRWLATRATPLGFELRTYGDEAIVLIGHSDIL